MASLVEMNEKIGISSSAALSLSMDKIQNELSAFSRQQCQLEEELELCKSKLVETTKQVETLKKLNTKYEVDMKVCKRKLERVVGIFQTLELENPQESVLNVLEMIKGQYKDKCPIVERSLMYSLDKVVTVACEWFLKYNEKQETGSTSEVFMETNCSGSELMADGGDVLSAKDSEVLVQSTDFRPVSTSVQIEAVEDNEPGPSQPKKRKIIQRQDCDEGQKNHEQNHIGANGNGMLNRRVPKRSRYRCKVCRKSFPNLDLLHNHPHEDIQLFASKPVRRGTSLGAPKNIGNEKVLWKCGVCVRTFKSNRGLKDHIRKMNHSYMRSMTVIKMERD